VTNSRKEPTRLFSPACIYGYQPDATRYGYQRPRTLAGVPVAASVPLIASFGTSGLDSVAEGVTTGVLAGPALFALTGGGDLAVAETGGDLAPVGAGEGEEEPLVWTARRAPGGT
jgi:hypothetical protein